MSQTQPAQQDYTLEILKNNPLHTFMLGPVPYEWVGIQTRSYDQAVAEEVMVFRTYIADPLGTPPDAQSSGSNPAFQEMEKMKLLDMTELVRYLTKTPSPGPLFMDLSVIEYEYDSKYKSKNPNEYAFLVYVDFRQVLNGIRNAPNKGAIASWILEKKKTIVATTFRYKRMEDGRRLPTDLVRKIAGYGHGRTHTRRRRHVKGKGKLGTKSRAKTKKRRNTKRRA